jgi:hypothetical protein
VELYLQSPHDFMAHFMKHRNKFTVASKCNECLQSKCHLSNIFNDLKRAISSPCRKHSISIVEKYYLLIRCLAMDVLLLRAYASEGMCLPSPCLAVGLYVTLTLSSIPY